MCTCFHIFVYIYLFEWSHASTEYSVYEEVTAVLGSDGNS